MKLKFLLATSFVALSAVVAQAQTTLNVTGATAFRSATIQAIIDGYGGAANVGIIHSNSANTVASARGANAISFSGTWAGTGVATIIRARFSGSTEGIRDLVGNGTVPNDVFYYPDSSIPAAGTITFTNTNGNPTGANVAQKPDVAFSDVQQTSSPYRTPALANTTVGVVTFVFAKSQDAAASLTNVTSQAWRTVLGNLRGAPLSVFTGNSADATERVFATGRNDGSGTRAVYLIETGYGVSKLVNQFKVGANGFNGITAAGFTGDANNILQLWPANDAEDVNNNSSLWPATLTNGNGGYFSGSNVVNLLSRSTASMRIYGPTGTELSSGGTFVGTAGTPRAFSVIACVGTGDGLSVISGGGDVLSYNGVKITPVPTTTDATGLVPADRYKVTNGAYTLWSYERLFRLSTLSGAQTTVLDQATTGLIARIPASLANTGIATSAMVATRVNDGDALTVP